MVGTCSLFPQFEIRRRSDCSCGLKPEFDIAVSSDKLPPQSVTENTARDVEISFKKIIGT